MKYLTYQMLDHCFITNDFAELPREPGNKTVARCWPLAFLQYEGLPITAKIHFAKRHFAKVIIGIFRLRSRECRVLDQIIIQLP